MIACSDSRAHWRDEFQDMFCGRRSTRDTARKQCDQRDDLHRQRREQPPSFVRQRANDTRTPTSKPTSQHPTEVTRCAMSPPIHSARRPPGKLGTDPRVPDAYHITPKPFDAPQDKGQRRLTAYTAIELVRADLRVDADVKIERQVADAGDQVVKKAQMSNTSTSLTKDAGCHPLCAAVRSSRKPRLRVETARAASGNTTKRRAAR